MPEKIAVLQRFRGGGHNKRGRFRDLESAGERLVEVAAPDLQCSFFVNRHGRNEQVVHASIE